MVRYVPLQVTVREFDSHPSLFLYDVLIKSTLIQRNSYSERRVPPIRFLRNKLRALIMVKTYTQDDGICTADMIHSAVDHLTAAKVLFSTDAGHYDSAGYIAHIGIELLLKGWIFEVSGKFTGTHNLRALHEVLVKSHGAAELSGEDKDLLKTLDQFESLRYPNRNDPTDVGSEDWDKTEVFAGALCKAMPASVQEKLSMIEPYTKGGRALMQKKKRIIQLFRLAPASAPAADTLSHSPH